MLSHRQHSAGLAASAPDTKLTGSLSPGLCRLCGTGELCLRPSIATSPCSSRRPCSPQIACSSRNPGKPRGPLWKGRILSTEAVRVVRELKRCKGDAALTSSVFRTKVARLIKPDMLAVLKELQRQNECELALKVFEVIRKEIWYRPDDGLYSELVKTLARNTLIEEVDMLYSLSKKEGLQPIIRFYTEVIDAHLQSGNSGRAMEVYYDLKSQGHFPCELAFGILRRGLSSNEETDLVAAVEEEYKKALEDELVKHALQC